VIGGAGNTSAYGKVHTTKNLVVVVGCDGTARVFDIRGMLGTGALCGTVLRSRVAKLAKAGDNDRASKAAAATTDFHSAQRPATAATTDHSVRAGGHSAQLLQSYMAPTAGSTYSALRASRAPTDQMSVASSSRPSQHAHGPDAAGANYDFVLQDSRDDFDDGTERGARRTTFNRSASAGRGGATSSATTPNTASRSVRAASVSQARSVSGGSEASRRSSRVSKDRASSKVLQSFVAHHKDRKKEDDMANLPLFELAALSPKESQVNARKLKNFLELNGTACLHALVTL
jgi:hypothetical protein